LLYHSLMTENKKTLKYIVKMVECPRNGEQGGQVRKLRKSFLVLVILLSFVFNPMLLAQSLFLSMGFTPSMPHHSLPVEIVEFEGSILLGAPTPWQISANILSKHPCDVYLVWGPASYHYAYRSRFAQADALEPATLIMNHLEPGQKYYYRLYFKEKTASKHYATQEYSFHTPKLPGQDFSFVMQSDSHLYNSADHEVYLQSLKAMAQFQPDFIFDLGDTFIYDEFDKSHDPASDKIQERSLQQRPYFDIFSRNAALFLTLGNHDGEAGKYFDDSDQNLAIKATKARKKYYLNPQPNEFYSGNEQVEPFVGLPQNYYAYQWGDALFVVLDYYRYSPMEDIPPTSAWSWTLGKDQYDWFQKILEESEARFKFVIAHHANGIGRGGQTYSRLFEWGGHGPNGKYLFDEMRPGWGKPIHEIMRDCGVNVFFQGHDHVFSMEVVDGIVYQTLPRPSEKSPQKQNVFILYPNAHLLLNSGFLKVDVNSDQVKISYYRSYFVSSDPQEGNTGLVFVYAVDIDGRVSILQDKKDDLSKYR